MNENCIKTEKLLANRISPFYYTNIALELKNANEVCWYHCRSILQKGYGENCIKYICKRVDKSKNITQWKPVKTELNNKTDRITIKKKLRIRGRKGPAIIQGTTIHHSIPLYELPTSIWFHTALKVETLSIVIFYCFIVQSSPLFYPQKKHFSFSPPNILFSNFNL